MSDGASFRGKPDVAGFFDPRTFSIQYIASDPATRRGALIDPVFDYDEKSGATATHSADALLAHVREHNFEVEWILDTHPHADHFSAAHYLKEKTGACTAIGARVVEMQHLWRKLYNLPKSFATDGSQWDHLFEDGDEFSVGDIPARVMLSPGHTLASITYVIGDAVFVHDTLFMPDFRNRTSRLSRRRPSTIVAKHPGNSYPSGGDEGVYRPRLPASRQRAEMGKHRRAPEARELSPAQGQATKPDSPPFARSGTNPCRCRS